MSRTIVQAFGPIYGEPVNGTVFGRPNGSVYVPLSNVVSVSITPGMEYFKKYTDSVIIICESDGTTRPVGVGFSSNALSQDLASNIQFQLFSDSDLHDLIGYLSWNNGVFNVIGQRGLYLTGDITGLQAGDTVYFRTQLMNNGTPVATSDVLETEWVVA